jgi:hypothetical protein
MMSLFLIGLITGSIVSAEIFSKNKKPALASIIIGLSIILLIHDLFPIK